MSSIRFGMRAQLAALFTIAFTLVFAGVFFWVYRFVTERTTEQLRSDLDDTLRGVAANIDGDDVAALYKTGTPRPDGFSDDPRYAKQMAFLEQVHTLEPRAIPYTMMRGDAPDTRRVGKRAASPEIVYVVDVDIAGTAHAGFLESDTASPQALAAYEKGALVDRPDIYSDRFGSWMSSYAPIRNANHDVVGLVGCDFEASYVERVQREVRNKLIAGFAVAYAVLLLIVYFAAGFFTRPVTALTRTTETLGEGTLGETSGSLERRRDELGALARAFNDMSKRLAAAFGDLERANEVLEERVMQRTAELAAEQEQSERLLRNVLPGEIADRLKRKPQTIAEGFDAVTVAFADIVGFTEMSSRSSPLEVVELLNEIFSAFDKLADKYRLEKIKTIGDAYMVVGGLPVPRDDHATAVADMALEMQAFMTELQSRRPGLAIRIGIHTGPVVAGVIGTRKFSYDLWGDTVNVASRMESHGDRDRIQVSDAAAKALERDFELEERGTIKVKGRGELKTYWLLHRRPR